jgi:hypothetical protein
MHVPSTPPAVHDVGGAAAGAFVQHSMSAAPAQ